MMMNNDRKGGRAQAAAVVGKHRSFFGGAAAVLTVVVVAGTGAAWWEWQSSEEFMRKTILVEARMIAAAMDLERIARLTGTVSDLQSKDYEALRSQIVKVREANPQYRYMYLMGRRPGEPPFFFMGTAPPDSADYSPPGQPYPENPPSLIRVFDERVELVSPPVSDRWGTWVSALIPLTHPRTGDLMAVFGLDIDAGRWQRQILFRTLMPILVTLVAALLLVGLVLFFRYLKSEQERTLLANSEKRFRVLFDNAPYAISINAFEDGMYLDTNKAFQESMGIGKEEMLHLRASDIIALTREDLEGFRKTLLETGIVKDFEATVTKRDGSRTDIVFSSVLLEIHGKPQILSMTVNVTEKRRAEMAARLNAKRTQALLTLNQMVEASQQELADFALEEAVRLTNSTIGYLAFLNEDETVLTMYAWSKSAMAECAIADTPLDFIVAETGLWGEAVRQRRPVITNDYAAPNPLNRGCPEGHVAIRRHMNVPVFSGEHIVLVVGVGNKEEPYEDTDAQELTLLMEGMWRLIERRQYVAALRQAHDDLEIKVQQRTAELQASEERFRTLFSASKDAVFVLDEERFLECNEAALQLFGCAEFRDFLDKHPFELSPPTQPCGGDSKVLADQHIATAFQEGRDFFEWVHRRADGADFPCEILLSPMRLSGKAVLQVVIRDITQRKEAAETLERAKARLEAANKELEAFSYSVSHDLRAPLRAIDGFSQALFEDYGALLDAEGLDYLVRVRKGAQRMGVLIDDMLMLSRATRGEPRTERVDLSTLAEQVLEELHSGEPGRNVQCDIQSGVIAQGDARMLLAVMGNLLGNAWKFTSKRKQAKIAFGVETQGGEEVFYIRDNGAGFDMRYGDKLFGAFQRLHSSEEFPGTGVGLATVQRIIHRHGGRVWAEAAVDTGACFYFVLGPAQ